MLQTAFRFRWLLVAAVFVAAGCASGGTSPEAGPGTSVSVDSGAAVSPDGLLTVIPPAGSAPVTITAGDPITELEGLGESLRAYELGPDGATFEQPVELRFEVTEDELAGGALVTARSSDGSLEALEATVDQSGESAVITAAIDHFTVVEVRFGLYVAITVKAPTRANVGEQVLASLKIELSPNLVPEGTSLPGTLQADAQYRRDETEASPGWSSSGSISGPDPSDFWCDSAGTGSISYSGVVYTRYTGAYLSERDREFGWQVTTSASGLSATVECVEEGVEVPPEDVKCRDRNTGEYTDGCTVAETVTVTDGETVNFGIVTDKTLTAGVDQSVVLSLFAETADGAIVAIECGLNQGCVGFYGAGFANFDADFPIESTVTDGVWTFASVPLTVAGSNVMLDVSPGELVDGSATVAGGPAVLTSATLYIQDGDLESVTLMSLEGIRSALTP